MKKLFPSNPHPQVPTGATHIIPSTNFSAMLNNPYLSNVIFIVEGKRFHAHKLVLTMKSEYFSKLINSKSSTPNSQLEIALPEFSAEDFGKVLRFIYTNDTEITSENYLTMYYSSVLFVLPQLRILVKEFMRSGMSLENVFCIWKNAQQYNDTDLSNTCVGFITRNYLTGSNTSLTISIHDDPLAISETIRKHLSSTKESRPKHLNREGCRKVRCMDATEFMREMHTQMPSNLSFNLLTFCKMLGCSAGTLFLYDTANKELFSHTATTPCMIRVPISSGIVSKVFNTGEPMIVQDVSKCTDFYADIDVLTGTKTMNVLAVPVRTPKREIIGVLEMLNKASGEFDDSDLHKTTSLADVFAHYLAHENANLRQRSLNNMSLLTGFKPPTTTNDVDPQIGKKNVDMFYEDDIDDDIIFPARLSRAVSDLDDLHDDLNSIDENENKNQIEMFENESNNGITPKVLQSSRNDGISMQNDDSEENEQETTNEREREQRAQQQQDEEEKPSFTNTVQYFQTPGNAAYLPQLKVQTTSSMPMSLKYTNYHKSFDQLHQPISHHEGQRQQSFRKTRSQAAHANVNMKDMFKVVDVGNKRGRDYMGQRYDVYPGYQQQNVFMAGQKCVEGDDGGMKSQFKFSKNKFHFVKYDVEKARKRKRRKKK